MAHHCEELALGPAGSFRSLFGVAQFLLLFLRRVMSRETPKVPMIFPPLSRKGILVVEAHVT